MTFRSRFLLAAACCAALALTGCDNADTKRSVEVPNPEAETQVQVVRKAFVPESTRWELDINSLTGAAEDWFKPGAPITLDIDENGRGAGFAGVNRYFTAPIQVVTEDGGVKFGMIGTTMMAGMAGQYEALFLKVMNGAEQAWIENGDLVLYQGGVVTARFTPAAE